MAEEYIDPNDLAELFGKTDASDFDWKDALDKVTRFFSSPQGIAGLGGAALGFADRAKPSGGGTTMAYPGAAQLTRKMVQGPYGPLAEYTGVGGGAPDYTRFTAPKVEFPTVGTTPTTTPSSSMSVQAKVDLYKQLRGYGLSDERVRRIAETMFGPQTDSDWSELTRRAGPAAEGIAGGTRGGDAGGGSGSRSGFTRDPNAIGASVMTPWYNKKTGQTYMASDSAWNPPSTDWVQGEPPAAGGGGGGATGSGGQSLTMRSGLTTEAQKIAEYNRLRAAGMTDAQVRESADKIYGKQTDADWSYLTGKSQFAAPPTAEVITTPQGIASLTEPIGYKAGDAQATFGNRVYGPRYEAELKDKDLQKALAVSGAKAVADASTAGGVYQLGDLTPVYAPNFSDPESVAQFEQYYPHAKQYGTSFFTPDVLEVDPGFAAYHNQSAGASIENAVEEARKRGENPVAARERIRAEQNALHNRLYYGKHLLAGASGAGGSSIDPTFLSSLGVDPYAGLDKSFRSALDLKPYESYTAPGETNPWGQYKEVLPALDVASGRLSYEQGQAIKQGYEANKNLQSYTQHTNIRDQMVKNLQNELANLKYDPVNLESYNRTREDLMGRIQSMGGETEQFKQNLAQSQDAMKPYADALSGIKDWSGLSSNLIKGGLGFAHGGRVQMEDGGFVMTKRAVDGAGGPRGIQQLVPGARMIRGPGTGTSDDIPAVINGRNGQTPALLSNGEAYVPKRFVQDQGGPQRMYSLMNNLQRKA